ncbi:MAG: hypothetical protein BWY68_00903 [bacterium ADurb.Bin400]|nr:MAG: hypothetical protein BWY68_00903 [bacterium ADurb.Bin400]
MPVQRAITLATSSSVTSSRNILFSGSIRLISFFSATSFFSNSGIFPYLISAARCKSAFTSAWSLSARNRSICVWISLDWFINSFSSCHCLFRDNSFSFRSAISFSIASFRLSDRASFSFFNASLSISSRRMFLTIVSISAGILSISSFSVDAASSMRSTALSGRKRSAIYRSDRSAAAIIALSAIRTP